MKKILLFLITICAFVSINTTKAQDSGGTGACDLAISNVVITKTGGPSPTGSDCSYSFNASFDITTNSGFKYLFFHSWRTGDYGAGSFDCSKGGAADPPTASRLGTTLNQAGKSFMDFGFIGLNNVTISTDPLAPTNVTANIATTYPNDGTVALNYAGVTATVYQTAVGSTKTLHFVVNSITVILSGACNPFSVKTDIWGSNSNSGTPSAQCYICGRTQTINTPSIALTENCQNPDGVNKYSLSITNGPDQTLHVSYKVYANANGNALQDAGDVLIFSSAVITLAPNASTSAVNQSIPFPYCCIGPWAYYGIYMIVDVQEFSNDLSTPIIITECATLPIKLRSFTADRDRSNVDLKWVTEIEDNNKGFYVERKLSNGDWAQVTFVASQAPNGNSNSPLTYVLSDFNNTKGISQYRLRQVDIDGKQAYSQVRSVRGEGQKSNTIIYPNPSGDGKVNIVFEGSNNNGTRNVSLMDVSGKTLKQWKGVTNNNIQIDNLKAGFYTVRIVDVETGEQTVEKFIVNKR